VGVALGDLFAEGFSDALAVAAQALVARYLGEEKPREARAVANRLLVMPMGGDWRASGGGW
jgi:Na+-driven multidrug efflux pump